ncbi:MAG: TonB family protein [Candidatus Omnitrophica bacterium]|nr:TonB family protein [Candidatus Omnitrophota bacterium]
MFSERLFVTAFLISVAAHGIILFQNPRFVIFSPAKNEPKMEVSYVKPPEEKKSPPAESLKNLNKEPFLKMSAKITADKRTPPPFVDKDKLFSETRTVNSRQGLFTKPEFTKPDIISVKKKITLPAIDADKINNPSYISYYQIVREKIRRCAYLNYARTETGEVYLSFVISNVGDIKQVRIVDEKSSPSPYLREIALKSISDAAPFPNFPKELDYPHLSFNVVISFEIE